MKLRVLSILFVLVFVFTGQVLCGQVSLGDGIKTGMTYSELNKHLKENGKPKLEHFKTNRKLEMHSSGGNIYCFSECTDKLFYKLTIIKQDYRDNVQDKLEKIGFEQIRRGNTNFYKKGDICFKFTPYGKNNLYCLWRGSISEWNHFVDSCNSTMKKIPE